MQAMSDSLPDLRPASSAFWSRLVEGGSTILRIYAECLFGGSRWAGALILAATAFAPFTAVLGLVSILSAAGTALALGLVSSTATLNSYTYSSLFIGLGAGSLFARPSTALALAAFGGAASAALTAGMRGLFRPVGLPPLSLPFVLIYLCAISFGGVAGADWIVARHAAAPVWMSYAPPQVAEFFEALGAIVFVPRVEAGLLVFAGLCLCGRHAPVLAAIGFGVVILADRALSLPVDWRWASSFNATFATIGLGMSWYVPSVGSYLRAIVGALACVAFTMVLAGPLGRLSLAPASLPFILAVYLVLLVDRRRELLRPLRQG